MLKGTKANRLNMPNIFSGFSGYSMHTFNGFLNQHKINTKFQGFLSVHFIKFSNIC